MAYINSANVKFPKADLIIEEDGSGNVTSCYNRTNSTEYVHPAYDTTAAISVTNNASSSLIFKKIDRSAGGNLTPVISVMSAGATNSSNAIVGTVASVNNAGYKIVIVSGDFTVIDNRNVIVGPDGGVLSMEAE